MTPTKTLFFTSSLGSGGAEMQVLRMLNYMDRERFDLSVALMAAGGSYERELRADVQVHHLPTGDINVHKLRQWRAIGPLRALIERTSPDVVCAVMDSASIVAVQALKKSRASPGLVMSAQVPPVTTYEHAKASGSWYERLSMKLRRVLAARAYRQADRIICISRGVEKEVHVLAPNVKQRTRVIYNAGIENSVLEKAQQALDEWPDERRPLLVACGRLQREKGFFDLIEALATVRRTVPAHLIILGEGSARADLEQRARTLGLTDCVHLPGFQENPFKYMGAADLFVLSSFFEGFGNVVVEAMACGTPVVATDCPYGPGEIITDGVNGRLVPPRAPEPLAAAIREVLQDERLQQRLSRNGRERAQDFEASSIAEAHERLFEDVAQRKNTQDM